MSWMYFLAPKLGKYRYIQACTKHKQSLTSYIKKCYNATKYWHIFSLFLGYNLLAFYKIVSKNDLYFCFDDFLQLWLELSVQMPLVLDLMWTAMVFVITNILCGRIQENCLNTKNMDHQLEKMTQQ